LHHPAQDVLISTLTRRGIVQGIGQQFEKLHYGGLVQANKAEIRLELRGKYQTRSLESACRSLTRVCINLLRSNETAGRSHVQDQDGIDEKILDQTPQTLELRQLHPGVLRS